MKKKIIFMVYSLSVGGTEKALLNMIEEMPKDKYEITILMLEESVGFVNSIPSKVQIEYVKEYKSIKSKLNMTPKKIAMELLKSGKILQSFNILSIRLLSKMLRNRVIYYDYMLRNFPKSTKEYDVAVAYAGPMDFISYFIVKKVKAIKKVQWIHSDVSKIGVDIDFASRLYKRFDKVIAVSNGAKEKLITFIPALHEKTEVLFNVISRKKIQSQLIDGKGFSDGFDGIRILTVGRLSIEKGQDLAIRALAKLVEENYKVRWYCLGEGNARKEYEKLIEEYRLKDKFILLGSDPNPYPYIANCDIYVQPSRHEGYCITLAEARCLNKPIVTTNFTGADEQIQNENTGLIVEIDENDIYCAVRRLITNHDLCTEFSGNLVKENFESPAAMDKIYSLI